MPYSEFLAEFTNNDATSPGGRRYLITLDDGQVHVGMPTVLPIGSEDLSGAAFSFRLDDGIVFIFSFSELVSAIVVDPNLG